MPIGMKRIIGGATVAGLGLVGLGYSELGGEDGTARDESGAIVEQGEVGAFRIRLGDCIGGAMTDIVESVEGIPCDQPHEEEVYHAFNLPDGDGSYPGDTTVDELAGTGCYEAFGSFVGIAYEESTAYAFGWLQPTRESWSNLGDREVLCLVGNVDGSLKTGSAGGTAT
jgi:hypothetical protein